MSLVIAVKLNDTIIFACDGFALLKNREDGSVKKLETRSKLAVFKKWELVVGYVGETEALVDIVSPVYSGDFLSEIGSGNLVHETHFLSEAAFLQHIGTEIGSLNSKGENNRLMLVCGYIDDTGCTAVNYFGPDGSMNSVDDFVCIGSGAEIASKTMSDRFSAEMTIENAVAAAIDAIYEASEVPTVNALPMIVIVKQKEIFDLTSFSIERYKLFRKELKLKIIDAVGLKSD